MNRLSDFWQAISRKKIRIEAIAAAFLAVLPALSITERAVAQTSTHQYLNSQNATIDDIVDNPAAYTGRLVTVRSEPEETGDLQSFLLDDTDGINLFGLDFDDDELLVFNYSGAPIALPEEDDVEIQVTGVVRPFIRAEVERELGIALDPEIYAEYEYEPAVFAQSLAYAPDPDDVTDEPEKFYGRAIAVEGNIDDIYSPYAFSLNDPDLFESGDVLVINTSPQRSSEEGASVVAVGELRPFIAADLERNLNLGVDLGLPGDVVAEYEQRPVLIVREVYPLPE
ncbi:hypothetical protein NDI45_28160 [Leptolyngbya sp. GB1-A1]